VEGTGRREVSRPLVEAIELGIQEEKETGSWLKTHQEIRVFERGRESSPYRQWDQHWGRVLGWRRAVVSPTMMEGERLSVKRWCCKLPGTSDR